MIHIAVRWSAKIVRIAVLLTWKITIAFLIQSVDPTEFRYAMQSFDCNS